MERETRSNTAEFSLESRKVEGYAIVYESPANIGFTETIKRGAITQELIDNSDVFCLLNHDSSKVLARSNKGKGSLTLTLDDKGLKYSFDAPNTEDGNTLLEHLRRGEIDKSSFAFSVNDNDADCVKWYRNAEGIVSRDIYKIEGLYDVSPVYTPAYDATSCSKRALQMVEELNKEEDEEPTTIEDNNIIEDSEDKDKDIKEPSTETNTDDENNGESVKEDEPNKRNINHNKFNTTMNTEFRLLKTINDIANNKSVDEVASAVINNGTEEMRKSGLSYGGQIQLPTSELRSTVTVAAEGEDVVATDLYDILEPLRAKNVLVQAGAKFLTNLTGDVQVPVMGAGAVTWEGETADAKDAGYTFTSKKLSPKRLTAYVDISKQFLVQDSKSAEALIRQDLINAINSKLEATILGSEEGTTTKPAGIFYSAEGLSTVGTYADIAEFEAGIEDNNVVGECKYIMSNKAKAAYRTMQKGNGVGFVYENGTIDGTAVLNTSNVADKNIAYGDWSNLAIGQWGAIDLTVDPYTKAAAGQVRLVINAYFDAVVLRPEAIVVGKEA